MYSCPLLANTSPLTTWKATLNISSWTCISSNWVGKGRVEKGGGHSGPDWNKMYNIRQIATEVLKIAKISQIWGLKYAPIVPILL